MAKFDVEDFLYKTMGDAITLMIANPFMTECVYTEEDDDGNEIQKKIRITPQVRKAIANWCDQNLPELFDY